MLSTKQLHQPPVNELIDILTKAAHGNFEFVSVSETQCPDFTKSPYNLSSKGIGGSPSLLDVGDGSNLRKPENHNIQFSLQEIANQCGYSDCIILGAGAVAQSVTGKNG